MYVGLLVLDCRIGEGHSLKEKRRILQSLTEHLKQRFNVSVAEVEHQDLWQRTRLAVSVVNSSAREGRATLDKIRDAISGDQRLLIMDCEIAQLY